MVLREGLCPVHDRHHLSRAKIMTGLDHADLP